MNKLNADPPVAIIEKVKERKIKKYRKKKIPIALKHALWVHYNGKNFESKCVVKWCPNMIDVFNFEAGHDIPESKGGACTIENMRPVCASCNKSMGNRYSITEFSTKFSPLATQVDPVEKRKKWWNRFIVCG